MSAKRWPAIAGHHARRVEPDERDGAVAGQQLAHLRLRLAAQVLVVVFLVVGAEVPGVAGAVRLVPVLRLRVVEAEADAALRAGVGELLEHVALERRGVDDVVGAGLRLEHREAVVMLRGDHDVFHARVLRELHPRVGVELHRVELRRELLVLAHGDLRAVHDPLAEAERALALPFAGWNRVEAPVDEEAVLGVAEPLEAFLLGGIRSGGRGLRASSGDGADPQQRQKGKRPEAARAWRPRTAGLPLASCIVMRPLSEIQPERHLVRSLRCRIPRPQDTRASSTGTTGIRRRL